MESRLPNFTPIRFLGRYLEKTAEGYKFGACPSFLQRMLEEGGFGDVKAVATPTHSGKIDDGEAVTDREAIRYF